MMQHIEIEQSLWGFIIMQAISISQDRLPVILSPNSVTTSTLSQEVLLTAIVGTLGESQIE